VVHCTATSQKATVVGIRNYWRDIMKWKSPGYHKMVLPDGTLVTLANDSEITNGVAGHNSTSLHISYIGGVDKNNKPLDNRTAAQKRTLLGELAAWKDTYPKAVICGHRDFPGVKKACPSFDARKEYAHL
jgi:N-acetylmuramoyl-L-alanine amidase